MKIAIVTLNGYWNYGNRLQNLALKRFLERRYKANVVSMKTWQGQENQGGFRDFKDFLRKLKYGKVMESLALRQRAVRFKNFSEEKLNESEITIDVNDEHYTLNSFDKVIVGSDQVWNTTWLDEKQALFFLLSSVEPKKRIAYAASLGVNFIESKYEKIFQEELPKFLAVSVREGQAAETLMSLTGTRYPVVLDPTMLLSKDEWIAETKEERSFGNNYVFEYILGEKIKPVTDKIEKIERGFDDVVSFHDYIGEGKKYYKEPPLRFVKAISEASLVVTDSFHAAVFAIMFGRQIIFVDRSDANAKMTSRIDTLLNTTGQKKISLDDYIAGTRADSEINLFELEKAKEKSIEFLDYAIREK